jgi:hypothetical protein
MLAALAPGGTARASVVIDIETTLGTGVVDVEVRGSLNLTGLTFVDTSPATGFLDPALAAIIVGPPGPPSGEVDIYTGAITGQPSFGPGSLTVPSDGSGSLFGIDVAVNTIMVPQGYVSGADLSGRNTYSGTLDTLGLEPRVLIYRTFRTSRANFSTQPVAAIEISVPICASEREKPVCHKFFEGNRFRQMCGTGDLPLRHRRKHRLRPSGNRPAGHDGARAGDAGLGPHRSGRGGRRRSPTAPAGRGLRAT